MLSPTDSPNAVESHKVSMYGKLTVLTILTILKYLLTIPYGIYHMMPSPTDSLNVVESLPDGKYVW